MKIREFIKEVEKIAPLFLQEEWDNSGFQIKLTDGEITKVLVALEINKQVVYDAILNKVDLILTHHPLIFGKINKIDSNDVIGNLITQLISHNISVYSTHTPFDKTDGGNNDYFGKLLKLQDIELMPSEQTGFCRVGYLSGDGILAGEFIDYVSRTLKIDKRFFNYAGFAETPVKKIGWCTGAGADFIQAAKEASCDMFITGDLKYHQAQLAREIGMNVLDCGHFATEQIFCENIMSKLDKLENIDIIQCDVNLNPFALL